MPKFKVGDKVRITSVSSPSRLGELKVGDVVYVVQDDSSCPHISRTPKGVYSDYDDFNGQEGLELVGTIDTKIKSNKLNMNPVQILKLISKSEPEQSFIKYGIMNEDETLTSDGKSLFEAYLVSKHKDDFKKEVVDPIIAEIEKENNK